MKKLITICLVIGSIGTVISTAWGTPTPVGISLEPSTKTVPAGDTFTLQLWLRSDPQGQAMDGADVILQWDPTYVQLDGKTEDGGYEWMMTFFTDADDTDGKTMLTLFAQLGGDSPITDLHAITLNFTALAVTANTLVTIPSSIPGSPPTCVAWQGEDITGELSGADITIIPAIPAPGAILLGGIGVGLVGWLRRRRIV